MSDQRAAYFGDLAQSDRPRIYLAGSDPEDPQTQWWFEAVQDDGQRVAIRQVEVGPSGVSHRYWWDHLEDEHGFLTDQPPDEAQGLTDVSAEDFQRAWGS